MKIDNHYEEHLTSQGRTLILSEPLRNLWEIAENIYTMAFNANCYAHIRTLLLQKWQQHEEVLRVSGAFIHFTVNSLTTSTMIEVSKIYDTDEKSKTIYLLDKKTKLLHDSLPTSYSRPFDDVCQDVENPEERTSTIRQFKDAYETSAKIDIIELSSRLVLLDCIAQSVKKQRNKLYAHSDFIDEQQEANLISKYPVTMSDINELIDFALDYSTSIIASITGLIRPKMPVNINDFEGLMQYILHGHATIQEKMKELDSEITKNGRKDTLNAMLDEEES